MKRRRRPLSRSTNPAAPGRSRTPALYLPAYDEDIFSDAAILDPYLHYAAMRDLGPLVHLPRHDLYAISRHADVRKALLNHQGLISAEGVGAFRWPPALHVSNTIASDGALHARFRQAIGAPLQLPAVNELTVQIETAADDLVARLVGQEMFDGIADFARYLPVAIVSSLVGLPEQGREKMLDWASAAFDGLGVANARAEAAFAAIGGMIHYVRNQCGPDTVKPGSWAAQIWDAVANGRLTQEEAGILQIDIVVPALDTTIFATGHLLHQLGVNPDQWARLKADPSLIDAAIEEAVRLESPIRAFARVAAREVDIDGAMLPEGARVLVIYASANRDERRWRDPDRFRIERPGLTGHVGFGQGRHSCAGMHLARLEMRSLLKAIVARVARIEVGTPVFRLNNILRGFASLPARFIAG